MSSTAAGVVIIFAAPEEGLHVAFGFDAVQPDGFSMDPAEMGMQPALIRHAQKKDVHGQVAGKQALGDARRVDVNVAAFSRTGIDQVDGTPPVRAASPAREPRRRWGFRPY